MKNTVIAFDWEELTLIGTALCTPNRAYTNQGKVQLWFIFLKVELFQSLLWRSSIFDANKSLKDLLQDAKPTTLMLLVLYVPN